MRRTEIELTEEQARRIEELAVNAGRSLNDVIRESVDLYLAKIEAKERALSAIGRFRSSVSDLGSEHDKYLSEEPTK